MPLRAVVVESSKVSTNVFMFTPLLSKSSIYTTDTEPRVPLLNQTFPAPESESEVSASHNISNPPAPASPALEKLTTRLSDAVNDPLESVWVTGICNHPVLSVIGPFM